MKRIILTVAFLLGGTAVASANPPGLTPGPAPQGPMQDQFGPDAGGPRGPMARGPGRGQRAGRAIARRLPPQLKARLIARFDRDGDGRLQGPERRAAKRFVRQLVRHRMQAQGGQGMGGRGQGMGGRGQGMGPRGGQGMGPRGGQGF